MTRAASPVETLVLDHDDEVETPRFAAQRVAAAGVGSVAERMLLNRARSEGEAHRRSESAEVDALD